MSEDEVQYLGTRTAFQIRSLSTGHASRPFDASPQRPVTGLVLHVKECNEQPPQSITFTKLQTSVVNVGRKSSSDASARSGNNPIEALFRCPVISRRHARIAFSDSGHVYIIDLNSHHGTYILKPGDTVSKMLDPETLTMLADGDVITFGKTVGRDQNVVRPVTARAEFLFNTASSPTFTKPSSPVSLSRTSSGRYGMHTPPSYSSSSSASSASDHDSDIEEVEPPKPSSDSSSSCAPHPTLPSFRALDLLRRLLPPTHTPVISSNFFSEDSPIDSPSPVLHIDQGPSSAPVTSSLESRFSSPMDLSSPSPPPEPVVVGAWPSFQHTSDRSNSPEEPVEEANQPLSFDVEDSTSDSLDAVNDKAEEVTYNVEPSALALEELEDEHMCTTIEVSLVLPQSPSQNPSEVSIPSLPLESNAKRSENKDLDTLRKALESIKAEIATMQTHRRKYKARFNANADTVSDKLKELIERVNSMTIMYTSILKRVNSASSIDIPALHAQNVVLQEKVDSLATSPLLHESVKEALSNREDVKTSVTALNSLVDDMKKLRQETESQMAIELEAVRVVRADALATIAAEVEASASTLKRKRSILDLDDDYVSHRDTTVAMYPTGIQEPPLKRPRRFVSIIAQTATAITLGAVATWSALAFS